MNPAGQDRDKLSDGLVEFVEQHRGAISSVKRSAGGASRITWLLQTLKGPCVLRVDPGDGPVAHTPLTLGREASVYRALANTRVRIPRLIAAREDAVLMEMAEGTEDLGHLTAETRHRVMEDYVLALAELHKVEPGAAFRELDPPADPGQAAPAIVGLWTRILDSRVRRPSPLAAVASRWMLRQAPRRAERLVVCHGDPGPGNFLHAGGRVTAMLDWEFVHVGDPMDDLGWLAFRGHHMGSDIGDLDAHLRLWQQQTGFEIDRRRIEFYRIQTLYVYLVSCLAALDNGARNQNRFVYLNLICLLNVIMPRAMLAYDGVEAPAVESALAPAEGELSEQLAALADLVALKWPPEDPGRALVELMARQVLGFSRLEPAIRAANLETVATLLGGPVTGEECDSRFVDWIRAHPLEDHAALQVIHANGCRRLQCELAMRPIADKPLQPI